MSNDSNARALAVLRIGVALFFLIFAQYKILSTQFTLHGGFQFWINKFLSEGVAYPFMAPILRNFVLLHATTIAFLVAYGELAIGLALLLGVFVRPARPDLHAHPALLLRLPRPLHPALAILRRQPKPLRLRIMFFDVPVWRCGISLVITIQKVARNSRWYLVFRAGWNRRLQHRSVALITRNNPI